jgi:hypothetical protein
MRFQMALDSADATVLEFVQRYAQLPVRHVSNCMVGHQAQRNAASRGMWRSS